MQNSKDLRAISQLLKQAQTMIDKYNLPPQKFLEQLGILQTQPETEIVFEKTGGRFHLFKALEEAKERIVIKCPWASDRAIDNDLMLRLNYALDQGVQIDLGWGYQYDLGTIIKKDHHGNLTFAAEAQYRYSAMSKLFQLQKRYSDRLHLKLTGGHSKYFVCDRQFAYVGSHNILSSTIPNLKIAYPDLQGDETGTIHRNQEIIQKLINRYDQAIDLTSSNMLSTMKLTA
jgi:phosphatidylserine/phosphatidylglycerophosphate/cardiolipin synthase-like enzyme